MNKLLEVLPFWMDGKLIMSTMVNTVSKVHEGSFVWYLKGQDFVKRFMFFKKILSARVSIDSASVLSDIPTAKTFLVSTSTSPPSMAVK